MNIFKAFSSGFPTKKSMVLPEVPTKDRLNSIISQAFNKKAYFHTFEDSKDYYYFRLYSKVYVVSKKDFYALYPKFVSVYDCTRLVDEDDNKNYVLFASNILLNDIYIRDVDKQYDAQADLYYIYVFKGDVIEKCYIEGLDVVEQMLITNRNLKTKVQNLLEKSKVFKKSN